MSQLKRFKSDARVWCHNKWVRDYISGKRVYPITLEIDPTNKCPLNCNYCIWKNFRHEKRDEIPSKVLLRLVQEAKDIGVKSIVWTGGGDPLANSGTLTAIESASKVGLKNAMFTNAVLMKPHVSDTLLKHLSWIRFHIDGATSETYSRAHQVPEFVFDEVVKKLRYFSETKKRKNQKYPLSGIGFIASANNLSDIEGVARLSKDLHIDYFQCKHDLTHINNPQYIKWWNNIIIPIMDNLSDELEDKQFTVQYNVDVDYDALDPSPLCHIHRMSTAITADGCVTYCKATRDKYEWSLGNIYQQSLRDIFDGERHRKLSSMIKPDTCGISPCPMKDANIILNKVATSQGLTLLKPKPVDLENPEFM